MQEFFDKNASEIFLNANADMVDVCLGNLSINRAKSRPYLESMVLKDNNPFYDYAARYWGCHATVMKNQLDETILNFLTSNNACAAPRFEYIMYIEFPGFMNRVFHKEHSGVYLAIYHNCSRILPILLDAMVRAPMNETGLIAIKPMHIAAIIGQVDAVEAMLSRCRTKIDGSPITETGKQSENEIFGVDAADARGTTPLMYAAARGHVTIVKSLLEHVGVDAGYKGIRGRSIFLHAAQGGSESVVKLLLEHGDVDVHTKDDYGRTPFSYAAERGRESVVKLLLEHGDIDVNSPDNNKRTPLSWAAWHHHDWDFDESNEARAKSIVCVILASRHEDVNLADIDGKTPLYYASQRGYSSVVDLLQSRGAMDDIIIIQ